MDKSLLGIRIRERRKELGLTMQDIANEINVNKSTIQRYENGKIKDIKTPVVDAIAKHLNVNPTWLLGETEYKNRSEDFEHATYLMNLYFRSVAKWSEDKLFDEKETMVMREHFWNLLFHYKEVVVGYSQAKLRWESSKEAYQEINKDRLNEVEIKEQFLETELRNQLKKASDWINVFPTYIAHNENRDD